MKIYQISKLVLIALFSLMLIAPVAAQDATETDPFEVVEISFFGYISFDADGNVMIDGYFLAPAGAIQPSLLSDGQYVEVTGIFLNDDTFKLTMINTDVEECDSIGATDTLEDDCMEEPEECDSIGATDTLEDDCMEEPEECDSTGATDTLEDDCMEEPEECDSTGATDTLEDDCMEEPEECDSTGATDTLEDDCMEEPEEECSPDGHPVAARIADAFDVEPCDVEEMHDEGNGFGNIAKAYLLAEAANQAYLDGLAEGEVPDPTLLLDPQAFIDMHNAGTGWGQIVKASGVHPSDLAPGKLKKRADNDDDTEDEEPSGDTTAITSSNGNNGNGNNGNNGNGNGKDKVKSNNGNGNNGNANANNGNGNGNNGNGNGNGKNKDKKGKKNK